MSNSTAVMFCKVTLFMSVSAESQAWNCRKLFNNYFLSQECPTGLVDEDSFKHIFSQFFPQGGKYLLLQYPVTCRNNVWRTACSKERRVALQMILALLSVRPLHCHGKKSHWCPFAVYSLFPPQPSSCKWYSSLTTSALGLLAYTTWGWDMQEGRHTHHPLDFLLCPVAVSKNVSQTYETLQ